MEFVARIGYRRDGFRARAGIGYFQVSVLKESESGIPDDVNFSKDQAAPH